MTSNNVQTQSTESELLYNAVFQQIQECGDIISSILIIYTFINENNINITFDINQLRQIALRSSDTTTSTYLWHINALIAASSDFEHLLLGIEMMFDRFLGNKQLFIKEREKNINDQKTKSWITTPNKTKPITNSNKSQITNFNHHNKNKRFLGNEIISFVNTYYDHTADDDDDRTQEIKKLQNKEQTPTNDENNNQQNNKPSYPDNDKLKPFDDNSKEYMTNYRGKISSPISFRLRQQKRMMQSERRVTSRNVSRNVSVDLDAFVMNAKDGDYGQIHEDDKEDLYKFDESMNVSSTSFEPEILSPFNVSKFAKTVDLMSNDIDTTATFQRKNV